MAETPKKTTPPKPPAEPPAEDNRVTVPGHWQVEDGKAIWVEGEASAICPSGEHPDVKIPRTATHFACEHGSWEFSPALPPAE